MISPLFGSADLLKTIMRLTLAAAMPLLARYAVQGACAADPRVLEKINEARQRLLEKPQNWKGKVQRFIFCSSRACITLPREIETVEAATVCNSPMKMRGPWYDMLESGPGPRAICGGDAVIDRGDGYVSFTDLDEPRTIKIYADVPESAGARLLLQGFDENGNRVRTWDETTGAYVDGEYVSINNETPGVSTTIFSVLDGIQKPETNGFVRIYAFTAGSGGSPATDVRAVIDWSGPSPAPGTLTWGGALVESDFEGTESLDVVLVFNSLAAGDNLFYTTSGVNIPELTLSGYSQESGWPVIGPIIAGTPGSIGGTLWEYTKGADVEPIAIGERVRSAGSLTEFTVGAASQVGDQYFFEIAGNTTAFTPGVSSVEREDQTLSNLTFTIFNNVTVELVGEFTLSGIDYTAWQNGGYYAFRIQRTYTAAVPIGQDYLSLMSILHPDETNPSYRRYEIPALRGTCGASIDSEEDSTRQVIVMAKLRYLPVKRGTDFLVIENIGALKHMLLAINSEEKNDFVVAQQFEAKAEKILGDELQNHIGDAATANQPMQVQQDCWAAGDIPCIL